MEWRLGLDSWIIQDGNYGDFACGDRLEAAVEFGFETEPTIVDPAVPSARLADGSTYDVIGKVLVREADVWVVDIGICVFNENKPPPGVAVGDTIAGRMFIGVDPFFYFERLHGRASMPPLMYTWTVSAIERQTAPWIFCEPRMRVRDPTKLGWERIERTNAWVDDDKRAWYVLQCELLGVDPKRVKSS